MGVEINPHKGNAASSERRYIMRIVYPTFIKQDGDMHLAYVPDIQVYTQGEDFYDAIEMARDAITLKCICYEDDGETIPTPSDRNKAVELAKVDADEDFDFSDGLLTYIDADTTEYRNKMSAKAVRKNCTIPSWLNDKAESAGINFSRVVQDALIEIVGTN